MHQKYDDNFYNDRDTRTRYSAQRIVETVLELITPTSVVDLGCGVGTWLDVFRKNGVERILGIEGPWVDKEKLVIGSDEFYSSNLDQVLSLEEKFDLAISLEVAEHIIPENAHQFVKNLTSLAPVILFSAAVPYQGGVRHLNEQWPSYWRDLFQKEGFIILDAIRPKVWDDEKMEVWYAQNAFMYVKEDAIHRYPGLERLKGVNTHMIDAVTARMFERKMKTYSLSKWAKNKLGLLR